MEVSTCSVKDVVKVIKGCLPRTSAFPGPSISGCIRPGGTVPNRCTATGSFRKTVTLNAARTSLKTIHPRDFSAGSDFPRDLTNLHEIYLKFDDESLRRMDEDKAYSMQKNKDISRYRKKSRSLPGLCFVEFRTRGQGGRYPTAHEVDVLTNAACSYSSITPIPSVPKMARSINRGNFGEFLHYIASCIESIEVRNKKCIPGYIPSAAALYTQKIVDFYLDHGINA